VLLALVGAGNRFAAPDASSYGKGGDAGIFIKSVLGNLPQVELLNFLNTGCCPE